MSFKTKSIIKNLLLNALPFAVFALIIYGLFNLAANTYGVLSFSLYIFASLGALILFVLFFLGLTSKTGTDNIEYDDDGIKLYRKGVGEDFIPWKSVTDVEIWRLPKGNIKVYIFTEKYNNSYTSPISNVSECTSKKHDALKLRCTEDLLQTIYHKRPDIEIKHCEDVQLL